MALTSNKRAAIHGLRQMVKDKNTPSKDKLRAIELLIELTDNFTTPGLEYRAEDVTYERAIDILEQARDHIGSEFLKNEYSGTTKTLLQEYSMLLRQLGDHPGADAAEQKAQSIVVRTDLTNPY